MFFKKKGNVVSKVGLKKDLPKKKFWKSYFFYIAIGVFLFLGIGLYRMGYILNKISEKDGSIFSSLSNIIPGGSDEVKGAEDGRINILLLGMRGTNMPGGGLLADTIILMSLKPEENKVALISFPRDLYVSAPSNGQKMKINAVHALGEEKGSGLEEMKKIVGQISGLPVHYAVSLNFAGFKQLIDTLGGLDVYLETAFYETNQFVQGNECGGEFVLPAGNNHFNGETALCYARARNTTSDFDRSKRQQVMLLALKDKMTSLGLFSDFGKINSTLSVIGDNVKTDMDSGEMKKFYEKYASLASNAQRYQRVFENSEEGMLTSPEDSGGAGYILIPRAGEGNYSQIQEICANIFTLPAQSDIQPIKQYARPKATINPEDEKEKKKDKKKDDKKDSEEKVEEETVAE